jgi:hypothetical protein
METISRHVMYGGKKLTAVTVNVLLIKTSQISIARCDISKICAHSLPVIYISFNCKHI